MYTVVIREMSKHDSPESEWTVARFPTVELAEEFARRWLRDSLEELRAQNQTTEELKKQWTLFGDDVVIPEVGFVASKNIELYIANPATVQERDWKTLKTQSM
jgi:hypothetical protein